MSLQLPSVKTDASGNAAASVAGMTESTLPPLLNVTTPNKQLFVNSGLKELFATEGELKGVETGGTATAPAFFNQKDPNLAILHEKPHHRMLIMLKMRGWSNREIAHECGFTEPWLSQLFRQPWAVALMAKLMTETGVDVIRGILESEAVPTLMKYIELRDDPETPKAVVKSTCDSLMDRYLGKPIAHVEVKNETILNSDDITELDKEIAALKAEEGRLLGSSRQ